MGRYEIARHYGTVEITCKDENTQAIRAVMWVKAAESRIFVQRIAKLKESFFATVFSI